MNDEQFRRLVESGNLQALRRALADNPGLANQTITWFLNQENKSDPLHYVCDCVFNHWLNEDQALQIAELLLEYGADIDGSKDRESPLIGATSLGAESIAALLLDSGANVEASSVFGARALHWAASIGLPETTAKLIQRGADIDPKCLEFGATPLFWAAHAMGPQGPANKKDPVAAAKVLAAAGADVHSKNKMGVSVLDRAREADSTELLELLLPYSNS